MMYQLIRESFPIAAKRHRCIWCGQGIEKGLRHRHEVSRYDELQDHRWHLECHVVAEFPDGEFQPYENERPALSEEVPHE